MLEEFNIKVNNRICFMDAETSYCFADLTDPRNNYQMFMQVSGAYTFETEDRLLNFIKSKALLCASQFAAFLTRFEMFGELKFDFIQQTLEIVMKNLIGTQVDVKALTDDEYHDCTEALLLSLWLILDSPVLFLNERVWSLDIIEDVSIWKDPIRSQVILFF